MKTYNLHGLLLALAAGALILTGTATSQAKIKHHRHHYEVTCATAVFFDWWPILMRDDLRYHREDALRYCHVHDDFNDID